MIRYIIVGPDGSQVSSSENRDSMVNAARNASRHEDGTFVVLEVRDPRVISTSRGGDSA